MKIFKYLKKHAITGLLIVTLALNYIIDNVLATKIISGTYIVFLLLHCIYTTLKKRPVSKKDKVMLLIKYSY